MAMTRTQRKTIREETEKRMKKAIASVAEEGNGVVSFDFLQTSEAIEAVLNKVMEENKDELERLDNELARLDKEIEGAKEDAASATQKIRAHNAAMSSLPRAVAKAVGLRTTLLTPNGSLSQAKVRNVMEKKGRDEAQAVIDLYNDRYVPTLNKMAEAVRDDDQYVLTAEEANAQKKLNTLGHQYNELVRDRNAILGR